MALYLSYADGVRLDTAAAGPRTVTGPDTQLTIGDDATAITNVLEQLAVGYPTYEALTTHALASGGIDGLRVLHHHLDELCKRSWLAHRVRHESSPILTIYPASSRYPLTVRSHPATPRLLSRFALLRRRNHDLLLECPTAHAHAVIHDQRTMEMLWPLMSSVAPRHDSHLPAGIVQEVMDLLWHAGFLTDCDAPPGSSDDTEPSLRHWEFHDLLFHARSRRGRHTAPYGATFRLKDAGPPPDDIGASSAPPLPLKRADLDHVMVDDWTLTRTLECRQSERTHGPDVIDADRLGEFLFRTAAVRQRRLSDGRVVDRRVYPSGGATYPLQVYLAIQSCAGVAPGFYRYEPHAHHLHPIRPLTADVAALVAAAAQAGGCSAPQVLIVLSARFVRVSWKYSSISYALILKEAGALVQTMYLVATAMRLSACAIGGGDADVFVAAAGTGYYDEGPVGELLLGACRHSTTTCSRSRAEQNP